MKTVNFKKALSLILLFAFAVTMLVGCGSTGDKTEQTTTATTAAGETQAATTAATEAAASDDEPGWKKDTSPITLDWYVNENWYQNPAGNLAHEMVKEQTGVDMNFIVPVGDPGQKLNTMIASNSLPDIVTMGWYAPQVKQIETDDYLYALSDLADKYDPYYWKVAAPDIINWYKNKNGKLYMYPCNGNTPDDTTKYNVISNRSFLVRKDIYEAIGKPDMRTPEGFLNALKAAKEKFPKADNGQPLVPFGTAQFGSTGNDTLEGMLLEYLAVPREINGQFFDIKCANPDPDYINWLKTFRKANEMGLIPTDVYVDDRPKIEEKVQQGRYFALFFQWKDLMTPLGQLYTNKPNEIYIPVDGPANSRLEPPKLSVSGYSGWEVTMITKNCKNPERAIKFLGFGLSEEGQKTFYLGKEGVTYDMVDGNPVIKPEVNTLKNADMPTFKNKYNTYGEIWMFNSSMMNIWEPDPGMPLNLYREFNKGKSFHYGVYDNTRPEPDTDELDILNKAETKWGEILPKLIMANSDAEFDKIWKDYEDYKTSINYQKALDYQRQKVAENKAKVGMK